MEDCKAHLRYMQKICLRKDGLYRHSPQMKQRGREMVPALGMALTLTYLPEDAWTHRVPQRISQSHESTRQTSGRYRYGTKLSTTLKATGNDRYLHDYLRHGSWRGKAGSMQKPTAPISTKPGRPSTSASTPMVASSTSAPVPANKRTCVDT